MPIEFNCRACGKLLRTPDQSEGKPAKCPHCESVSTVPHFGNEKIQPPPNPHMLAGAPRYEPFNGKPHRGPTVLTMGIVSMALPALSFAVICCCAPITAVFSSAGLAFGIPAWIMGQRDLQEISQGLMDPQGHAQTQTGMILGIIGVCLSSLGILIGILGVAGMALSMATQ